MMFWLEALPGFLIISSVYRIVNIVSLVMTATAFLLILVLQNVKSQYHYCIILGADKRHFGIRVYIPHLLKYRNFWCISSALKELYCVSEAPLVLLKAEL